MARITPGPLVHVPYSSLHQTCFKNRSSKKTKIPDSRNSNEDTAGYVIRRPSPSQPFTSRNCLKNSSPLMIMEMMAKALAALCGARKTPNSKANGVYA
mmetsp:Transcript_13307/g.17876  ORF Transcript_13307/g.17876 Transcript_13307/m.17876 type:complete len:98 (-) Transcript_13307:340-633(-)